MDNSNEMINDIILEKINKEQYLLQENEEYKAKDNEYTILVRDLFKTLNEEEIILFDKIIDVLGDMQTQEVIQAYKTATKNYNDEFSVPYYIVEEIVEYYKKDKPISRKYNTMSLMNLAKVNNRLTENQVKTLRNLCDFESEE